MEKTLATPERTSDTGNFHNHSNGLFHPIEKDDTSDLFSDEDSSIFKTDQFKDLSPVFLTLPSMSKLRKMKQVLSEANARYVEWKISELVLSTYKTTGSDMPPHTVKKVNDVIKSSSVLPFTIIKNRRGESFNLLGLEEANLLALSKTSLLSSEKKELTNKMMISLDIGIQTINKEKEKLKGVFGSHCLKVIPADTALSEERVQQAQVNDQMKLQLDQGYELLTSASEIMYQTTHLKVDAVRQLQNTSYLSFKDKAKYLCNNLSVLKHKMDKITLADVNHTRSLNVDGEKLKISVDSLSEKRKSLLKILEKYERKEKSSKIFSDIVSEYAKTKKLLNHQLQTLKVLNETD